MKKKKNNHNTQCSQVITSEDYIDYIVPYKDVDMLKKRVSIS